jgi:uncharacterized protein
VGNLHIPIIQVPRKAPLSIDEGVDASEIQNADGAVTTLQHIQVTGTLMAIQRDFLFQGTVTGTFEAPCDRCIEPASVDETVEVSWLFEPGKVNDAMEEFAASEEMDDDEEYYEDEKDQIRYYEGDELNLTPHAEEEMVLALPAKIYCTDDCKGLCPQCGANLNRTTCECKEEQEEENNTGLKALRDLYPDLPTDTPEE